MPVKIIADHFRHFRARGNMIGSHAMTARLRPPLAMLRFALMGSLLGLTLSSCSSPTSHQPRPKDRLVRVAEDDAKGLDPQSYSDLVSTRICSDLFEGLTRMNANGEPEPGLADKWQISGDGLTWTFRIRPSLTFPDGHKITAETFEQTYRRLLDPKTSSPHLGLFEAITSLKAQGTDTVVIQLAHPFPALPELLAHPAMAALPVHRKDWSSERPLQTSGAYQLTEWVLNDHARLEANPAWHDGAPAVHTVEWRPMSDTLSSLRLFQAGGADIVGEVPFSRIPGLKLSMPDQIRLTTYRGSYYFAFNTRKPPFNDQRVRLALSLAIEREWIATALLGSGIKPGWGIIPPGTTGLSPYQPEWAALSRPQRLARAQRLLSEAGYGPAQPLNFDIRFNSDADHRRIAVSLAAMWKPLGVEAHLLNSEASLHFASLRRGDFALARSGWIGDISVPENFLSVHQAKSGPSNYSGFDDKTYDALLEKALQTPDPAKRAQAMRNAEVRLIEQMPIIPVYFYVSKSLVAKRVSGWQDNLANVHPSRTLSFK